MPLHITRNDISNMRTQAVVCPSNSALQIDGGAGYAVALRAGLEKVQKACDAIGGCQTGKAVATPAFDFPAKVLVHAVGPVWKGGDEGEVEALRSCVTEALEVAVDNGAETVAIPLMSSGLYGFPPEVAVEVETQAIEDFLEDHDAEVWLVLYDNDSIRAGRSVFDEIEEYIDDTYVGASARPEAGRTAPQAQYCAAPAPGFDAAPVPKFDATPEDMFPETWASTLGSAPVPALEETFGGFDGDAALDGLDGFDGLACFGGMEPEPRTMPMLADEPLGSLADRLDRLDESFAQTVLRLIDERGMTDVEVYKRANISRQLFAKIRKDDCYRPTKRTACALAFALGLDLADATTLLRRAGFALSHSSKFDIIVEYFLLKGNHNIYEVNEALFAFDQPLLG